MALLCGFDDRSRSKPDRERKFYAIADGIKDASCRAMSKDSDVATSYEEITDKTVPMFDMFGPPRPAVAAERELEARVREAFRADPRLAQMQIDVVAHDSGVWLSGTASGPGSVAYAADVARSVDGVTEVHNAVVELEIER